MQSGKLGSEYFPVGHFMHYGGSYLSAAHFKHFYYWSQSWHGIGHTRNSNIKTLIHMSHYGSPTLPGLQELQKLKFSSLQV